MREFVSRLRDETHDHVLVDRISMNSPLTLDLLLTSASGGGVATALVYLFKNPDKLGQWWPKVQTSWYSGRREAEKARRSFERLREAKPEVRELER